MKFWTGCFVSAVLAAGLTTLLQSTDLSGPLQAQSPKADPAAGPRFLEAPGGVELRLAADEQAAVRVYERTNRSVVNITTSSVRVDSLFLLEIPSQGTGSGVILDPDGHVLTNFHVLEGAREVTVTLFNGESFPAEVVGSDAINDLAVVRIDAPPEVLHPAILGDSNALKVGMRVYAIGNPFGLERTMTTGIISSLNRSLQLRGNRSIRSIIQIDAAVNPGNSGGPLLNSSGHLIGINTAIATNTGQSAGVGFAIPVNLVRRVAQQLIRFGRVIRPEIGIQRVYETGEGLLIARLTPGGPAEKAGLRGPRRVRRGPFVVIDRSAADLIVEVDTKPVTTADDFLSYIEQKKAGDTVSLTVQREGRRLKLPVTLETTPR